MQYLNGNVRGTMRRALFLPIASLVLVLGWLVPAVAQTTTGSVRGLVKDSSGAVIGGAKVSITDKKTNSTQNATTNAGGEFFFTNLPNGQYEVAVEATNFKKTTVTDVTVNINQTTDLPVTVEAGGGNETVEVSAAGTELVETTTTTLASSFESRKVVELAQTTSAGGIYNLALTIPNVTGSGGIGVGTGGSVGGQRPRNNNFMVDGVDNNDKSVTGPAMYISPETVSELSVQTNQSASEFGRSTGGQFIVVTKSGTNQFHGSAYFFLQNRNLNALDVSQKIQGVVRDNPGPGQSLNPRFDNNRFGGNIGGPIVKNKLFFFTSYEGIVTGLASGGGGIRTPTAAGFAALAALPTTPGNISAANLAFLRQYLPVAATSDRTITVLGQQIPIGPVAINAPNFANQRNFVLTLDFNQDENDVHRFRFLYNRVRAIDAAASLPVFFTNTPTDNRLTSYTWVHTFSPTINNELRLAYRRQVNDTPVPSITAPFGLDTFPNIGLGEFGVNIGPNPNAPQGRTDGGYQLVDNVSWVLGNHSLKFGVDVRRAIGTNRFIQRVRGDYQYTAAAGATERFLRDLSPNGLAQRTVGGGVYSGNQTQFFGFFQDDWRTTKNLTLNLGLRYVYQQAPFSADEQQANAVASAAGVLQFRKLKTQKANFSPVVGIAYAPDFNEGFFHHIFGNPGESSIRAGFSMARDVIFDNIYLNARTGFPQFSVLVDRTNDTSTGFFAGGAIPSTPQGSATLSTADARRLTTSYNPDQKVAYSMSWSLGVQRQLGKDWGFEIRYLGTRGVNLIVQQQINRQAVVNANRSIPTFFAQPTAAQLAGLTTTVSQLLALRNGPNFGNSVPSFLAAGFFAGTSPTSTTAGVGGITAQSPIGNSTYHALSLSANKRYSRGYYLGASYTWSRLIDDSTAELFSTVLTPRRAEDFQNLRNERSVSALDSTHRFTLNGAYDLPFFLKSNNWALRTFIGGFQVAGTLTFETGKPYTPVSGVDSNLNGDTAGDRTVINPAGTQGVSSTVRGIDINGNTTTNNALIVAYVANNSNARYVQAGLGARANGGRNTLRLPGINNLDLSVSKNFNLRESLKAQFRADFFNFTNTPQFIPGSLRGVNPIATSGAAVTQVNTAGNPLFNTPQRIFSGNPRIIQLALRLDF
jgi:hypothetical protein